jgi:tetratricopeptide (TPR) repeat protein
VIACRRRAAGALALAALSAGIVAALYARALPYGLVWMDESEIGEAEIVLSPAEPWSAAFTRPLHRTSAGAAPANPYYRPLQILVVSAIHRFAGPDPRAYRALALALAVAAGCLFGALAWAIFADGPPALAATALALAHPAGIEAWVWISGLADALSTVFTLACVGLGLLAASSRGGRSLASGLLALGALALALLAKEKSVVAPALLAAVLAARRLAGPPAVAVPGEARRAALLLAAMAALATGYVLVWRPAMLGAAVLAAPSIGGSHATHLLSAIASWPASLGWLLVPLGPTASDAVAVVRSPADPAFLLGLALPLLSAAAGIWLLRRGRPVAALGLAWIWIAFLPTANLFPQIHARADRYLLLSVFGAALLLIELARAGATHRRGRVAAVAALAGVALLWAGVTWMRTPAWRSTETLFAADVVRDPGFREGRLHLARSYFAQRRYREAEDQLEPLLASLSGEESWSYVNAAGVRELACANDLALGRAAEVSAELAALEPRLAQQPGLQACRARAEQQLGRPQAALAIYESLVRSLPADPPAAISLELARLHAQLGDREQARAWLARARRDGPREPAFDWELRGVEKLLR